MFHLFISFFKLFFYSLTSQIRTFSDAKILLFADMAKFLCFAWLTKGQNEQYGVKSRI